MSAINITTIMRFTLTVLKIKLALLGIALSLSPLVFAEDSITFANITSKGSGCPDGSTSIVLSPDRKTVSVLFSEMVAEVPQFDGDNENDEESAGRDRLSRHNKNMARKVCLINIEADVLPGYRVTEVEVTSDFRGLTIKEPGTSASFSSRFLEWSRRGRQKRKVGKELANIGYKSGMVDEDWFESKSVSFPLETTCGEQRRDNLQFVLKNVVKARILKKAQNSDVSAFISLDSADLAGVLKLKLKTQKCDEPATRLSREEILRRRRGLPGGQRDPRVGRGSNCPRGTRFNRRSGRCVRR